MKHLSCLIIQILELKPISSIHIKNKKSHETPKQINHSISKDKRLVIKAN